MHTKKIWFISLLVLLILFACKTEEYQLNTAHKTPEEPGKYPKFSDADYVFGSYGEYRKNNDVFFYEINIDVDIDKKRLNGWVDMHFEALEDLNIVQIDLRKNYKITSIMQDGHPLEFNREKKSVIVTLAEPLKKGRQTKIRTFYNGKAMPTKDPPWEGGLVWDETENGEPWVGVACEGLGASAWWPVKDHLYDEPDSTLMHFTIPEGLFCVSNGRLKNRKVENGKETFTWKVSYCINTYNVTFYAGNFEHFQLPYEKGNSTLYLDFYVLPENLETAKTHFEQSIEIIRFFEEAFGEYPWWRDGFKLVESPYAGMEHQSAIAYGNGYENETNYDYDHIILHEAAHEWWGNSVSAFDYAEIWLHEGFATYSEALFLEHVYGYDMYLEHLKWYSYMVQNEYPVIGPYDLNFWHKKDADVYFKGANMLHTLRNTINNDSVFMDIIKTFYQDHKYSIATNNDFMNLVNEKTGSDYSWFFDAYLFNRACPQLDFSFTRNPATGKNTLKYKWANMGDDFKIPIEVEVNGTKQIIRPSGRVQRLELNRGDRIKINTAFAYIARVENTGL